jgi:hypothetical protein
MKGGERLNGYNYSYYYIGCSIFAIWWWVWFLPEKIINYFN